MRIRRQVWRRCDADAGISLVSLIVIVVVVGALAAITVLVLDDVGQAPRKGAQVADLGTSQAETALADKARCEASATAIESAALAYFVAHGQTWPADLSMLTDATPPYLQRAPDPRWGLVYDNTTGNVDATGCDRL
jgi:hypothetical protein